MLHTHLLPTLIPTAVSSQLTEFGAEEASCRLLHTWINLALKEVQLLLLVRGIAEALTELYLVYQKVYIGHLGSFWLLTLFIHAD